VGVENLAIMKIRTQIYSKSHPLIEDCMHKKGLLQEPFYNIY